MRLLPKSSARIRATTLLLLLSARIVVDSRTSLPVAVFSEQPRIEQVRNIAAPVAAAGVLIALLYWGRLLFITSFIAVMLAFMLEPFVNLLMRFRLPRALASFVVCSVALLLLYLVGLGAYSQLAGLLSDVPKYSQRISEMVERASARVEAMEKAMYQIVVPARQRRQEP
ncbi:MAG: AI-2E family transporter, partial [Acidobacteria bacterium]|nr:AI-2E family transporter [Acidobacteriota bacterium]